jgi:hypothetical protein
VARFGYAPNNTISWYYAVSTYNVQTSNNSSSGNGLLSGLASLAGSADPNASKTAVQKVTIIL